MVQIEFVFIAEAGELERQALLLCESIRTFGGRYAEAAITILQPRAERPITAAGRTIFEARGAQIVELEIVSPCPEYGTSYRVLACAAYEPRSSADRLIFLDSDMVMLAEPDLELDVADVAARPVDVKGMATAGVDDPNDVYWRELCRVCEVDYDAIPQVMSTVDRLAVKAAYNGGLTVVNPQAGLFQKTADFFLRALEAKLSPWPEQQHTFPAGHGTVSVAGGRLWGSAQACLSLAITALKLRVRLLPASQNFPLHSYPELRAEVEAGAFSQITLVHYHHLFRDHPYDNPLVAGAPGFPPGAAEWLKARAGDFWKTGRERLVVVLGMHRSGTSMLTKGLEVLGVDLGSDFHPATPDNPKGFWEDRYFHGLNEELMADLGHSWDAFALLETERVLSLCEGRFFIRALALVRQSFRRNDLRGLKDPRFSVLLPFWKRVFAAADIPVSYVISFRNPLSVAHSLATRDAFPTAKSLWLWVVYNVLAIRDTAEASPLVVDYDALMDDPRGQLARMSRLLDLPLDETALAAFASEFLDPTLRHARFTAQDLRADPVGDPLLCTVYETLCAEAQAAVLLSAGEWAGFLSQAESSLGEIKTLLQLASEATNKNQTFHRQLAEQDFHIQSLRATAEALPARETQINELEAALAAAHAARGTVVAELEARAESLLAARNEEAVMREALARDLADRNAQVESLLTAKDEEAVARAALAGNLAARSAQVESLLAAKDEEAVARAALAGNLAARSAQVESLASTLQQLETKASSLQNELLQMKASRSWRLTAPFRRLWKW